MLKEFRDFLMRGNVVDLAVAVVIGAAFGRVITAFVDGILMQLIAAIIGEPDFGGLSFTLNGAEFMYGLVLNALIVFVAVAAAIFFLVVKPMNALQDRLGTKKEDEVAADIALLTEIRDELRAQRAG